MPSHPLVSFLSRRTPAARMNRMRWILAGGAILVFAVAAVIVGRAVGVGRGNALPAEASPIAGPAASPSRGGDLITWEADIPSMVAGKSPWVNSLVDGGDAWLVSAVTGDLKAGPGASVLFSIDPKTGKVLTPVRDAELPETVPCATELLNGQAVCVWDGQVHLVDPRTAEAGAGAFAAPDGTALSGAAVAGQTVIAAGLKPQGAVVEAFDANGEMLWDTSVSIDGCFAADPESTTLVSVVGDVAKVGVGAFQALVDVADGEVEVKACGRTAMAASGALAVLASGGGEPEPPTSYTDAAGATHKVWDFRTAGDVVALTFEGRSYFAVIDAENYLSLVDAESGEEKWKQAEKLSGSSLFQGSDDNQVYLGSVNGIKAVGLTMGTTAWTWMPGMEVAYRTASVTPGGVVLAMSSSGIVGLDPVNGEVLWTIDGFSQAGWYWFPATAEVPGHTTVVAIGPARDHLTRLDIPALP